MAMLPALSPASTRFTVTPGFAASNFGTTVFVQKSRMFWSDPVYQSMRPSTA